MKCSLNPHSGNHGLYRGPEIFDFLKSQAYITDCDIKYAELGAIKIHRQLQNNLRRDVHQITMDIFSTCRVRAKNSGIKHI